mmetsp:Transcript_29214/g.59390  ORF Transcript_29214/g.59390 Transcript_29214/m.59390 type:complete len:214 (-) Transcript_29214:131-772(-)
MDAASWAARLPARGGAGERRGRERIHAQDPGPGPARGHALGVAGGGRVARGHCRAPGPRDLHVRVQLRDRGHVGPVTARHGGPHGPASAHHHRRRRLALGACERRARVHSRTWAGGPLVGRVLRVPVHGAPGPAAPVRPRVCRPLPLQHAAWRLATVADPGLPPLQQLAAPVERQRWPRRGPGACPRAWDGAGGGPAVHCAGGGLAGECCGAV